MNSGRLVPAVLSLTMAGLGLVSVSCVHEEDLLHDGPGIAPSPGERWTPPSPAEASAWTPDSSPSGTGAAALEIPPHLAEPGAVWSLSDLMDVALRASPRTRIAWSRARSAAASLGAERGSYYPSAAGQVSATRQKGSAVGGQFTFLTTTFNPYVQLSWILLDFGRRSATVESARQTLLAADWAHNQSIQDVILEVEQAYYQYLDARALEEAERSAVSEAEASLDAAERRRAAGLATIADVLQARTRLSEARLLLESVQGQLRIIEGALATSVGLPANTHLDVDLPSPEIPRDQATVEIDQAIREAQASRPDLAAARALAEKAEADVRATHAEDRPSLSLGATGGRIFYDSFDVHQDTYGASLLLTIPIFNGFTYQYDLLRARAERDAARSRLEALEQQITLQVWTSYFDHKTADVRVDTVRDLVESASQSYEVASARYDAGVGSILDLLTAQSALHVARAQEVRARTDWFLTLAQLAHHTGILWEAEPGPETEPHVEGKP